MDAEIQLATTQSSFPTPCQIVIIFHLFSLGAPQHAGTRVAFGETRTSGFVTL